MSTTSDGHTTFPLRDVGLSPGHALHEDLQLVLAPYVQGGVEFIPEKGSGKPTPRAGEIRYEPVRSPVPARLDVTAMDSGWSFRLRFEASFTGPCSRCLDEATLHVGVDAHEVHDPDAEPGPELDVTRWAQECVALQVPSQVLCREDCRGLCPQCGANLNDEPEHEHEQPLDSRWDALKALQVDDDAQ
jgi:uncharacterized protein